MIETDSGPESNTSPIRAVYPGLTAKIAVVTGGSRGIGAATAAALVANGASVAVVGRDRPAIDATVIAITVDGGRAIGVVADCTLEADVDALRQVVTDRLGPVDTSPPSPAATGCRWPHRPRLSPIGAASSTAISPPPFSLCRPSYPR